MITPVMITPTLGVAAPSECADWIAKVVSTEGRVETRVTSDITPDTAWQSVTINQTLCPGSAVRTQAHSRAALLLRNHTVLRLNQTSTLTLPAAQPDKPFWLELLDGAINVITRTPQKFQVDTPFVTAAVDGTEFFVKIGENKTTVAVFEGRVIAENPTGRVVLRSGEAATAGAGQAPVTSIPINPRDAVQWALHYPPILSYRVGDFEGGDTDSWQTRVRKSIEYTQAGDLQNALASIIDTPKGTPENPLGAAFFGYRASLLLNVGRVNEANSDIEMALGLAPNDGIALALQSVIAVAQNHYDTALTLAQQAVTHAPQKAGAWMALSYAQQATNNLPEALTAAQRGADSESDNALVWARIAELHLMTGNLKGALSAASKATALNPNLARTQSVLGFAYLTQIKTRHARQAFEQAIALDSADPLPRLGLGLAKIRDGDLAAGREDIEIATALDPNNALVRSYMGKAYYEERRDPLAASQFDIAKTLDPKDPTPWFYDAILKQSTNRPVEALQDLQKSIELNDNRAVYRSRLLLDSDSAARSASQARIYSDLGFQQLALRTAWRSLDSDPANYSAHRFLADSYAAQVGQEIARVSELLQAQLLQPANTLPIQPQLAESTLEGGPARVSFNEFNPLFTGNGTHVLIDAVAGSNATWGEDVVVSGLHNRYSYSIGQYHYETDGFRANNDLKDNIYNLYVQAAVTPTLNIQGELRQRETSSGDVNLNFDPTDFSITDRRKVEQGTLRLGGHYAPTPNSDVLLSLIKSERDVSDTWPAHPTYDTTETINDNAMQSEARYLWRMESFNLTTGVGMYKIEENTQKTYDYTKSSGVVCRPSSRCLSNLPEFSRNHQNAYIYANAIYPEQVIWTVGLGYDAWKRNDFDVDVANPKFGVQWILRPGLHLRAAYFKTVKRTVIVEQTIEPTQIAGFNQFFDDPNGTKATRYGLGLDVAFSPTVHGGMEVSRRNMDVPTFSSASTTPKFKDRHHNLSRAYLYWTPSTAWVASVAFQTDSRKQDRIDMIELNTTEVPLSLRYFTTNGWFTRLTGTYVTQNITPGTNNILPAADDEHFMVVDAVVGYRLPRHLGVVNLEIGNLLDKQFRYQDVNFLRSQPVPSRFIPELTILGKFTLNF